MLGPFLVHYLGARGWTRRVLCYVRMLAQAQICLPFPPPLVSTLSPSFNVCMHSSLSPHLLW